MIDYKIFTSEDWDWFVLIRKSDKKILYTGNYREQAYVAYLKDIDIELPSVVEKNDDAWLSGDYDTSEEDWYE